MGRTIPDKLHRLPFAIDRHFTTATEYEDRRSEEPQPLARLIVPVNVSSRLVDPVPSNSFSVLAFDLHAIHQW